MSIEVFILVSLAGLLAGMVATRLYRWYKEWRFGRNGFKKGDKIICTIIGANGEHEYTGLVKKVKKSTITLEGDQA